MSLRRDGRTSVVTSPMKLLRSICLDLERLRPGEGKQLLRQVRTSLG